jgi:hypothetical protein
MDKWRKYWAYAGERAIKTVAQTAIATLTAAGVVGVLDIDIVQLFSVSALAGLMSLLTSVLAYDRTSSNS